jgi:AcrR family transcriptional regulator
MMPKSCEIVDPRIRRTRQMLRKSLHKLLAKKEFDEISVQDITEMATVNRATFYDHYTDKFALLECMVGADFNDLLAKRGVQFDEGCDSALRAIVVAVCDYLARMKGPDCRRQFQPHMEAAIIGVVRRMFLEGLKRHPSKETPSPEMIAAAASWAIYGAAKEWAQTPDRCPAEKIADMVTALVSPILHRPVA